jgi:CYTH domain-containing protein
MKLEIEKKFLLKSIPEKSPDEIIKIDQWYNKNNSNIWERARKCESSINGTYYIHTIKKTISKGVNLEDEKELSKSEYDSFVKNCKTGLTESRFITKERYVYNIDSLKWEVDIFHSGHHLVIAELEIPKKTFKYKMPLFILDKLLLEVTGLKQFSNKNLSNKIEKTSN